MEALQSYLFENSQDFPEGHYLKLMDLLLKAHKQISPPARIPLSEVTMPSYSPDDNYYGMRLQNVVTYSTIQRIIEITLEQWESIFKDEPNYHNFLVNLRNITPSGQWIPTQYIFPPQISARDRQQIHILANYCDIVSYTYRNENTRILNVFVCN